jgi:putative peptidoglycan lipid II flippase
MGIFFHYLINLFNNQLSFENPFKSIYLILSVLIGLGFYLIVTYLIKAFKIEDIKLKY